MTDEGNFGRQRSFFNDFFLPTEGIGEKDVKTNDTIVEEYSWKAHDGAVSSILYVPEKEILVSGSFDDSCKIWKFRHDEIMSKSDTIVLEKKIEDFEHKDPNHVIRWDDNTFLCGTDLGTVHVYSLNPPYESLKVFDFRPIFDKLNSDRVNIVDVMKLYPSNKRNERRRNTDIFVVIARVGSLGAICTMSYSKGTVIHLKMDLEFTIATYTGIRQSQLFPNCIIFNCGSAYSHINMDRFIHLFRLEDSKVVKSYDKHDFNIYGFHTFLNLQKNREIIVCGGNEEKFYFYDVESSKLLKKIAAKNSVCSFSRLGENHFLVGEGAHYVEVINIQEFRSPTNIVEEKQDNIIVSSLRLEASGYQDLDDVKVLTNLMRGGGYCLGDDIQVAVASNDDSIYLIKIKGLEVTLENDDQGELIEEDSRERKEYLLYDESRYIASGEKIKIKVCGLVVIDHEILRYFL